MSEVHLNVQHRNCHEAADAFWKYWEENGETHKHGYYESTWGAINAALKLVGVTVSGVAQQNEDGTWTEAVPLKLPWWDRALWRIFGKHWVRFTEWWSFN